MKKILIAGLIVVGLVAYVMLKKSPTTATTASVTPVTQTVSSQTPNLKDGSYTGTVADAFYGNLQVSTTITGGKISDVQFLQYPNDKDESVEVNTRAMPLLKSEAITAQNANVDIVSGATQTSEAFRQTLQSALDQAK